MSVGQMGDDLASGFVDSLGKGPAADNHIGEPRQAPRIEPYPSIDGLLSAEPSPSFTGDSLSPVTSTPGGSNIVGDLVSGYPRDGVSQAPARVGPGDMISDYEVETGGPEDEVSAMEVDAEYDKAVGDMVSGMPRNMFPSDQFDVAQIAPEGLVTGQTKGGYAPGTNQPTSLDRGVAGPA
jgi:hypothetical protein